MKKYFVSFAFLVLFGGYAAFQYLNGSTASYTATIPPQPVASAQVQAPAQQAAGTLASAQAAPPPSSEDQTDGGSDNSSENAPQPAQTQTTPTPAPAPAPAPAPKPTGQYVDGTYTGSVADAYYGNVQVQAVISGGKLVNVVFLQYPSDRSTSRFINQQAMPILIQEAVHAQSANVNGVSGASETSPAFVQSLASALSQAKS